MTKPFDKLWINATIAPCVDETILASQALGIKDGKIAFIGELTDAPETLANEVIDVNGQLITPGLIDCHTHLIYAGNRAHEFEMRLKGIRYEAIAKQGGGIQSTVNATRAATEEELFQQSIKRARALMQSGATTIEIKSGYGLDLATELKMLRVAKKIAAALNITIQTTFLGAHTVPQEFKDRADDYVNLICNEMIPVVAKEQLATSVDVFCETIGFSLAQTERIFKAATSHGLSIKCHAEQLSCSHSAALAAKFSALSVDHLEHLSTDDIQKIADAGTVAVLLPGAFYFLRETKMPPIELLREHHVPIAIASDCNPGTSPFLSLPLIMNMACTMFRLTPMEALLGLTKNAANALGMAKTHGTLEVGKTADIACWDVKNAAELAYDAGHQPLLQLVSAGRVHIG